MSNGKYTIGDIKASIGMSYQSVEDIKITTCEGTHGRLSLTVCVDEGTNSKNVQALSGQPVHIHLVDGTRIFAGVCKGAGIENQTGYKRMHIEAVGRSEEMDREPKDKVFQDPGKTLSGIAQLVAGEYGAEITLDSDVSIPHIISQNKETDWAFLKRIAASYKKVLYADILEDKIKIFMGKTGFREHEETILGEGLPYKDVSEMARMEICDGVAESYMIDRMKADVEGLTVSAGDNVGIYTIRSAEITTDRGMLVNRVEYGYPESIRPDTKSISEPGFTNSVLQGTVTAVAGNMVQVQYDTDSGMGAPTWIPYESAISNSFYSMPDEGDRVFIYYENSGKAVCLGSRHVNTGHPDMEKPEEKVLTNHDKMIKFTQTGVTLSATRELTDNESSAAVSIEMDDEGSITVTSGRGITWYSEKSILLGAGNVSESANMAAQGKQKLEKRIEDGKKKFESEGGALLHLGEKIVNQELEKLAMSLDSHFINFFIKKDEEEAQMLDAETFETGVLTLYGYEGVQLSAGNSSIEITNGEIMIKTGQFQWLGYEQLEHEKQEQPLQDWWETALDGLQFALDVVGFFCPAADIVNAGISLLRGDITGAGLSLISAIPVVGDAVGAAKTAVKATKAVTKVTDAVNSIKNIEKMIAITKGLYMMAQGAYNIYLTKDGWAEIADKIKNKENPFLDPGCVSTMINTASGGFTVFRGFSDATGMTPKIQNKVKGAVNKAKNKAKAVADKVKKKNCKGCGDPIDVVTGSLTMEYEEMTLHDVLEDFVLHRIHDSVHTNEGMFLGDRWFLSIETRLIRDEDTITLQRPDMHLETFVLEDGIWKNERNGDMSIVLSECTGGYAVKDAIEQKTYFYNTDGQITSIEDACRNRTVFEYQAGVLSRMSLAGGQYLDFEFEANKLRRITDILGRHICYEYDKNLLVCVTMPDGGEISYTYTNDGYIHTAKDQNGNTYMTCEYDRRGRVVRQTLPTGEEYMLHYDDRERRNTFTNLKNGQHIIYEYGRQRVPLKEIYADGTYTEKRYDEWENCIYERDRNGNETFMEYDIRGNLLKETLPNGVETSYEYDENNHLIRRFDTAGACEEWKYDACGNVILYKQRTDGDRYAVTSYTRDSRGRMLTLTNPLGNTISYIYETGYSSPSCVILPGGKQTHYDYDEAGRLMVKRDNTGRTMYGYSRRDRLMSVEDVLGNTTRYSYDYLGNLLEEILPEQEKNGQRGTRYRYDALDRRIMQETPEGNLYLYEYGNEDCLTLSIHPNEAACGGKKGISYDYDTDNNRIRAHYPDGGCERYFYDANGNLIKRVMPESYDPGRDDGEGYIYAYDCMNRLVQVTDPSGTIQAQYRYDKAGNITGYREGCDMPWSIFTYSLTGRLLSSRKPVQETESGEILYCLETREYDRMGSLTQVKRYLDFQTQDSVGGRTHTITYVYDSDNLPVKIHDSTGAITEYFYDSEGRLIKELSKTGEDTFHELRYILDEAGRVIKRAEKLEEDAVYTGSLGYAVTEFAYDANGSVTKITLPEGGTITYVYDSDGRLTQENHEDKNGEISNCITYAYDYAGNLISRTDSEGNATSITHDLMDREITVTAPDGGTLLRSYDKNGNLSWEVLPQENAVAGMSGKGFRHVYDHEGRLLTVQGPDGSLLENNTYDPAGRLIREISGAEFSYDLAGRRTAVTTPGGNTQRFTYDAMGNMTSTTDPLGNTTVFTADEWGRTTKISKADQSQESYTYDHTGNMTSATDGEGNTVTYTYNCRNLMQSRTDGSGNTEHFRYDRAGNTAESTDRNGITLHCTYNMYGSLTSRRGGDINESYGYYPDGKLKYAIGGGMRYDYRYDVMGRLEEKSAGGRTLLKYAYDFNGNRTSVTDVTGKTTQYTYDALDRIREISDNGKQLAQYSYNPDGTVKRLEVGAGIVTEYSYDVDKNLTSQKTVIGGMDRHPSVENGMMPNHGWADITKTMVIVDNTYSYDANANRTKKQTLSGLTSYSYDGLNRLIKAEYPTGAEEYSYDRAGNRTTKQWTGPDKIHKTVENYHYDSCNRLTSLETISPQGEHKHNEYTYDRQGNMLSDGNRQYSYDAMNRLKEVINTDGSWQKNRYDGEGLRAELEENGKLVSFIYNEDKVVSEKTDNNTIRYIRGYDLVSSDSESARTYYHYACDELGSITHITNEAGNILNRYEYDAFGNFTLKEETIENRFAFTGEQYDPVSQLYYLRARFYSPAIARFMQEDTYYGDGLNLYSYCHNNPVMYVDPSGHYAYEYYPNMFDDIDVENGQKGLFKSSSSTNLGKNMFEYLGIDLDPGKTGSHQKQHLIPQKVYKESQFLQDIGFNIDSHYNGIFDKNMSLNSKLVNQIFKDYGVPKGLRKRYISEKTNHNGGHKAYNVAVKREVKSIEKYVKGYHQKCIDEGMDIKEANRKAYDEAQRQVGMLVEDLRTMNRDGIDLYRDKNGGTNQDLYNQEFEKKRKKAHKKNGDKPNWHHKY